MKKIAIMMVCMLMTVFTTMQAQNSKSPFIGDWELKAGGPLDGTTLGLSIKDDGGKLKGMLVAPSLGSSQIELSNIQVVSAKELKYSFGIQGIDVEASMVLKDNNSLTGTLAGQYPFEGGNRAVIISDAENMTVQAQNCLLKILEEPPRDTYFLLTSAHPDQLLTTVRSRCRPVKLIPWDTSYIVRILTQAGADDEKARKTASVSSGSIGNALRLLSDDEYWNMRETVMDAFFRNTRRSEILRISTGWKEKKNDSDLLFGILEDYVHGLASHRFGDPDQNDISEFPAPWQRFANEAAAEHFTGLSDRITEARGNDIAVLRDFEKRSRLEEVSDFVQVYAACRDTGGDMINALNKSARMIGEKIAIKKEIAVMVSQKKFEGRIITCMPFVIIVFLRFISPEYLESLYSTWLGRLLMTVSLAAAAAAYYLIERITDIEV